MSKVNLNEFEGHTPGPWRLFKGNNGDNDWWIVGANDEVVLQCGSEPLPDDYLSAAAPDLLAELIEACERIERLENALNALAQTAGDDPFFNEGGEGYEALFGVKSD